MIDLTEFPEEFIADYLNASNLPVMSDRYYTIDTILEPTIRRSSYVLADESGRSTVIGDERGLHLKKRRKQLTIPSTLKPSHKAISLGSNFTGSYKKTV